MIPVGFGVQKIAGTMIWATDIVEEKHTREVSGGIPGGGQKVIEYRYFANFAVAFGEGPASDILRLWAGEELIFDRRNPLDERAIELPGFLSGSLAVSNPQYNYRIYLGTEDQEPDGLIVREVAEDDAVPANRGMIYVVFERLPLAEWNNQIPPITAEVAWSGERPALVRNASFALHPDGTSFDRGGLAIDFARGYIYLEQGDNRFHRFRTSDMVEDLHWTVEDAARGLSPNVVDYKGDLYCRSLTTVACVDGDTLQRPGSGGISCWSWVSSASATCSRSRW